MKRNSKISGEKLPYISLIYGIVFGLIISTILLFFVFYNAGDMILLFAFNSKYYFIAPIMIFMVSLWVAGKYIGSVKQKDKKLFIVSLKYAGISLLPATITLFLEIILYFNEAFPLVFILMIIIVPILILLFFLLPWFLLSRDKL